VDATVLASNWLQHLEGDIDVAHIPYVHTDNLNPFANVLGMAPSAPEGDGAAGGDAEPSFSAPHVEVADTPAGFAFAARVQASDAAAPSDDEWWSIGHFMFPFYANLPYGGLGSYWVVARVPMDDYHTMTFALWKRGAPRTDHALMFGTPPAFLENTADWFGRFRLARNPENDFKVDRERSRLGASGISGQAVQDAAITASMGPIADRRREHLGKADVAITHLRRRLLAALDGIDELGAPGVDVPSTYRVKHGSMKLPRGASWHDELRRRGGVGRIDERHQPQRRPQGDARQGR
jgi:hypothetical protein